MEMNLLEGPDCFVVTESLIRMEKEQEKPSAWRDWNPLPHELFFPEASALSLRYNHGPTNCQRPISASFWNLANICQIFTWTLRWLRSCGLATPTWTSWWWRCGSGWWTCRRIQTRHPFARPLLEIKLLLKRAIIKIRRNGQHSCP